MTLKLLPCPFCGNEEPSFERMGTNRQSCIVVCGNCGARHESGDEYLHSGSSWNERAVPSPGTPSDETPEMGEGWCVTVERWGDAVLTISDQHYSGKELAKADEALIIGAAKHLLAFVGYGLPPSTFDPEPDSVPQAEPVP